MYFAARDQIREAGSGLLELHGKRELRTLGRILPPEKQAEQSLRKLMEVLREYYEPKKVVMVAQFHRKCTINC